MEVESRKFILMIAIGPVQQFIAQARKTRDLWFGSHLLSELSKFAAIELINHKVELVFPYISKSGNPEELQEQKVANKLVGVVETNDPRNIAFQVRRATVKHWITKANEASELLRGAINLGMWDTQIKDFIDFYAVWIPYDKDYSTALKQADVLMAARKTLRDFTQNEPKNLFGDKKSSLDAGRESVIFPDRFAELYKLGIKDNETLDAISLVKRLALRSNPESKFPSVCDIAFLPYREQIKINEQNLQHVKLYYNTLLEEYGNQLDLKGKSIDDYESALFYENRIGDFVDDNLKLNIKIDDRNTLVTQISNLVSKMYVNRQMPQPKAYYAFIVCDGDRMGEHLRLLNTIESHQKFSEHLSKFAKRANEIINTHQGQLVYSGGDDVMAYLPLESCLKACGELRSEFESIMREVTPDSETKISLSIGLVIVHMLERLGEVRKWAHQAEQIAKVNRNELAIVFHKRSGGTLMNVSFSFDQSPVESLNNWKEFYQKGVFSSNLAYELRELYLEYERLSEHLSMQKNEDEFRVLLLQEAERLANKKKPSKVSPKKHTEVLGKIQGAFVGDEKPLKQLKALAEQMIIAIMIAKEVGFVEALD